VSLNKISNEYAQTLRGEGLYDAIPKAVLAAIAISYATGGGDWIEHAKERIVTEWNTLHENGIIPQSVPAKYRKFISEIGQQ